MASSGNYPTFNPLVRTGQSLTHSNGNLEVASGSFWSSSVWSRMTMAGHGGSSGKYYAEFVNYGSSGGGSTVCGVGNYDSLAINTTNHNDAIIYYYDYILQNGTQVNIGGNYSSPPGISGNEVLRIAWDCSNGKVWLGASQEWFDVGSGVGDPANGNNPSGTISTYAGAPIGVLHNRSTNTGRCIMNFGQNGTFNGTLTAQGNSDENGDGDFYYSVPTGFICLNSKNLTIDSDIDPAQTDDDIPQKQFNTVLYTGNATNGHGITGLGLQPDMVWFQRRSTSGSYGEGIIDSNRGASVGLYPNRTEQEANFSSDFVSFDSDGFTLNAGSSMNINNNSSTFVAWCWKAGGSASSDSSGDITVSRSTNDAAKFSILTYTGNGSSGSTIAHGLGVKPAMTIIKQRNSSNGWNVWHQGYNNGDYDSFGELNSNSSWYANQGSNGPYTTDPTTSLLTLTAYGQVNGSSNTYVAYVWADVEGFQKFGSYVGNGNADGAFIYTGFRPRMIFLKRTDSSGSWHVFDTARNTFNPVDTYLLWDTDGTDDTASSNSIDFLSNGFKIRNNAAGLNTSGGDYVYGAWGDVPFKYNNTF